MGPAGPYRGWDCRYWDSVLNFFTIGYASMTLIYYVDLMGCPAGPYRSSDALLLKQMPKKQTGFVLLLKQNKSDLVFHHQN